MCTYKCVCYYAIRLPYSGPCALPGWRRAPLPQWADRSRAGLDDLPGLGASSGWCWTPALHHHAALPSIYLHPKTKSPSDTETEQGLPAWCAYWWHSQHCPFCENSLSCEWTCVLCVCEFYFNKKFKHHKAEWRHVCSGQPLASFRRNKHVDL